MKEYLEDEVKSVCEHYGIDVEVLREYEFYPLKATIVAGALRLVTDRQTVFIKRSTVANDQHLHAIFEAVEGLAARGARVMRFLHTKYRDPYVIHETGCYYALPQLSGRMPDLDSPQEFMAALATLAEWHVSAKVKHGILYQPRRVDLTYEWNAARAKLQIYREYALEREEPTELDTRYLAIREDLDRQVGISLAKLRQIPYEQIIQTAVQRGHLCHGSFVRQNLLVTKDGLYVLDHDHLYEGSQMIDLAHYLHRYGAQQSFDIELCQRGLATYESIRPIGQEEWRLLEILLRFPVSIMRVLEWYYEHRRDWEMEDFIDAFEDACHADVARMAFRRHLFGALVDEEPEPLSIQAFFAKYGEQKMVFSPPGPPDEDENERVQLFTTQSILRQSHEFLTKNVKDETVGLWRPASRAYGELGSAKEKSHKNQD